MMRSIHSINTWESNRFAISIHDLVLNDDENIINVTNNSNNNHFSVKERSSPTKRSKLLLQMARENIENKQHTILENQTP